MIRGLLVFALILMAIHAAYVFVSPIVKNTMLEGKMQEVAKNRGVKGQTAIHREMMKYINEKNLPIASGNLVVRVNEGHQATIASTYSTTARFLMIEHQYDFYPASEDAARLKPNSRR